jgi:hypothetical protein
MCSLLLLPNDVLALISRTSKTVQTLASMTKVRALTWRDNPYPVTQVFQSDHAAVAENRLQKLREEPCFWLFCEGKRGPRARECGWPSGAVSPPEPRGRWAALLTP